MNSPILIPALVIAGVLGWLVFLALSRLEDRQVVRDTLRHLDGFEVVENQRSQEMLAPLRDRAMAPLLEGLTGVGRRFTPTGYVDKVRLKFAYAGNATADSVDRFLAVRVVTAVLAVLGFVWVFFLNALDLQGNTKFLVALMVAMVFLIGPDAWLNRRVAERQHLIQISLPDILDLLTISVEAGLGFEQALDRVIDSVPGPLSDEFARMLGETRAGSTRSDSMRAMDERINVPELRAFVLAIIQADTFGVSIGRVLRAQSEEMRIKRRQLAQEKAQKAPVKMLIPMVFCIFPALFVVVIGPAVLNIRDSFH